MEVMKENGKSLAYRGSMFYQDPTIDIVKEELHKQKLGWTGSFPWD